MKKATILILILALASVTFAGTGKRDKHGAFVKQIAPVENTVSSSSTVDSDAVKRISKVSGPRLQKSTTGASFNLPFTSNYDYGWNSGIRDFVDVDADGNVHIAAFVNTDPVAALGNRHVVYWFDPGGLLETSGIVSTQDGMGWANVQVLSDGRATIVYHQDTQGFLIDVLAGFGLFTKVSHPVSLAIWMHTQIGSDDVVWYATSHSEGNSGSASDSTLVWFSNDEGTTWTQVTTVTTGFHVAGPAEPVVRVSMDNSEVLVKNEWDDNLAAGADPRAALDSTDMTTYAWSTDNGTTWNNVIVTFDPYLNIVGGDTTLVADVFMSAAGTEDTLIVENFSQTDITYDYLGNVHMVMNGYSWHWDPVADSTQNAWPILHYSSARGELAANFVEITDTDISHSDWLHTLVVDSGWWSGNNIGIGYPTISAAPDTSLLVAVWVQPRYVNGQIDTTVTAPNDAIFMENDVWMSASPDLGDNWTAPEKIVDTPNLYEAFPTLAKPLTPTGTPGEYAYHLMYLEDHVPGVWIFATPESEAGLAQWVYMTDTLTIPVIEPPPIGVEDDDAITATSFSLKQNYPNPFNPSTRIEFALNERSRVTITVYNMLGQEVTTLVDGVMEAGGHNITWDASNAASGVYFYKLSAGDISRTKKMVLLR